MSIGIVIGLIISHALVFVLGALVYRNNAKKSEGLLADVQGQYAELKKKYDALKGRIG